MAVDKVLCLTERYQDKTKFTITDESEWLDDAPDRREDAARILVATKMDEEQQLEFIAVLNTDPLATISWLITSSGSGAYRFFYIDIPLWDTDEEYVAEVITDEVVTTYANFVYHNEVFYKAIADNDAVEPGVTSGWEDYWEEYDGDFHEQIESDILTIHIHDDISTMEYEECIMDKVDVRTEAELCGACCSDTEFLNLIKMQFFLDSANANNWHDKAVRAEVILQQATKKFCC
jgi:hypothetical protein